MTATNSFRDLEVWRESMLLVEDIYGVSQHFPAEERFGLTSQLRRAAISIPSNIGEGSRRKRRKVFINHLDIALGSQAEVDVQSGRLQSRVDRIGRMLNGLIVSLQPDYWDIPGNE